MKNRFYLLIICLGIGAGCHKKEDSQIQCTNIFIGFGIFTVDGANTPTEPKSVEVKNQRTGLIYAQPRKNVVDGRISYAIATDLNVRDFSVTGDVLTITVISKSNKAYTSQMTIARDEYFCHIDKLSGSDKIIID